MKGTILGKDGEHFVALKDMKFDDVSRSYVGKVVFANFPPDLKDALIELFELIEDQTFALVDEAQARADAFDLRVQFEDGKQLPIDSLAYNGKEWFGFKIKE